MTARTFAASLSGSTTALGEAASPALPTAPSAVVESRALLLGVLNAWSERVAIGEISAADYAAKARALVTRTA